MKTTADAIAEITAAHPLAHADFDFAHLSFVIGTADKPDALYISASLALESFVDEVLSKLKGTADHIRFIDGPHLDKWEITIRKIGGAHRLAEPRWSVVATIGLVKQEATQVAEVGS